jgi:hypothetical protein
MLSSAILRIGIMVFGLVSLATATPLPTENNALGQVPCAADMECPTVWTPSTHFQISL